MVRQLIADFLKANPVTSVPTPNVQRCRVRWSKPIPPLFQINFNGAVFNDLGTAGVGAVVQDSQGMVLASMSEQIPLPHSVVEVEVIAAAKAVNFAQELCLSSVVFEGDFEIFIKDLFVVKMSLYPHMVTLLVKLKFVLLPLIFVNFLIFVT